MVMGQIGRLPVDPSRGVPVLQKDKNLEEMVFPTVFKTVNLTFAAAGEQTVWTPAPGKRVRLIGWVLSQTASGKITLKVGGAAVLGPMQVNVGVPLVATYLPKGLPPGPPDGAVTVQVDGAKDVGGVVYGVEE